MKIILSRIINKKNVLPALCMIIFLITFFLLGYHYGRRDFVIYKKGQYLEVYPTNKPLYNLRLREFSRLYMLMKQGREKEFDIYLKQLIDFTIKNAKIRLLVAPEKLRAPIVRALEYTENAKNVSSPTSELK
jgi:hypothetical protein